MNGFYEAGKKIKYYRTQRGYSKAELAKKINISLTRLDEIENGKAVYQFKTLEKIAQALKIELLELLNFD